MRTLAIAVLLCLCGIGCTMRNSSPAVADLLPSSFYTIDPTRDTTLTTAQGARLTIPAGAFEVADSGGGASGGRTNGGAMAGPVRLEVKEAYTLADIIRGRLLTTSKGMPLSSGGMIYINVAGGTVVGGGADVEGGAPVKLRKAIRVAIPTRGIQEGMQVFKGKKDDAGRIDWVDPRPLLKTAADSMLATGKALFMTECGSCHRIGKTLTGPDLAWITERTPDKKWLHDCIHNYSELLGRRDAYSCYLYNRFNKTQMNVFSHLGGDAIDLILNYISNASQTIDSTTVPNYRRSFDSCQRYVRLRDSLLAQKEGMKSRRNKLIANNGPEVTERRNVSAQPTYAGVPVPVSTKPAVQLVESVAHPSEYYQFDIDNTGWFNVDVFCKNLPGLEESSLQVRIKGELRREANVYLVIPGLKVFLNGGSLSGKDDVYGFYKDDGMIPLPQGVPAFVLCMGEYKGQPFWGKVQFTTSRSQELTVEPEAMSKEAVDAAIAQLHIEDLRITVKDAKNAGETRQLDTALHATDSLLKTLAGMRPEFCDCGCHFSGDSIIMEGSVEQVPPVQGK